LLKLVANATVAFATILAPFQRHVKSFCIKNQFVPTLNVQKEGKTVKENEKKPVTWEVTDPKPPVIRSGHMENRKQN
jgi:hypothetical protein